MDQGFIVSARDLGDGEMEKLPPALALCGRHRIHPQHRNRSSRREWEEAADSADAKRWLIKAGIGTVGLTTLLLTDS
jgi:hypothetical protein